MADFYFGAAAKSIERFLSDINTDEKKAIRTSNVREVDAADGVSGGKAGTGLPTVQWIG